MRNIKRSFTLFITLFLLVASSCTKGERDVKTKISPSDKSLLELTTCVYDEKQLMEITGFTGSMSELDARYPIECLRKVADLYRVSYLGEDKVAVLIFDNEGNILMGNCYRTRLLKKDFNELRPGLLLDKVREMDPDGFYPFLYTGRNDYPRESSHYTRDGYLITIQYNTENVIIHIEQELL